MRVRFKRKGMEVMLIENLHVYLKLPVLKKDIAKLFMHGWKSVKMVLFVIRLGNFQILENYFLKKKLF
jgi:hypothetical protein